MVVKRVPLKLRLLFKQKSLEVRLEWLLDVPYYKKKQKKTQSWKKSNWMLRPNSGKFQKSLPPVLPTMVGSNKQACVCPRVLTWRWLGKHCHKSYHCSAIPPFRELFECHSYWAFSCKVVIFTDFTNYDHEHLFGKCNKQNEHEKKLSSYILNMHKFCKNIPLSFYIMIF